MQRQGQPAQAAQDKCISYYSLRANAQYVSMACGSLRGQRCIIKLHAMMAFMSLCLALTFADQMPLPKMKAKCET